MEEVKAIKEEQVRLKDLIKTCQATLTTTRQGLDLYAQAESLQNAWLAAKRAAEETQQRLAAAKDDERRLKQAKKAATIAAEVKAYEQKAADKTRLEGLHASIEKTLDGLTAQTEALTEEVNPLKAAYEKASAWLIEQKPRWEGMRREDQTIAHLTALLNEAEQALAQHQDQLTKAQKNVTKLSKRLAKAKGEALALKRQGETPLEAVYQVGREAPLTHLETLGEAIDRLPSMRSTSVRLKKATERFSALLAQGEEKATRKAQAHKALKAAQSALKRRETKVTLAKEALEAQTRCRAQFLAEGTWGNVALEDALAEAKSAWDIANAFEAKRHALSSQTPCPLCGSMHHPYVEGNAEELHAIEARYLDLKVKAQTLKALNQAIEEAKQTLESEKAETLKKAHEAQRLRDQYAHEGEVFKDWEASLNEAMTSLNDDVSLLEADWEALGWKRVSEEALPSTSTLEKRAKALLVRSENTLQSERLAALLAWVDVQKNHQKALLEKTATIQTIELDLEKAKSVEAPYKDRVKDDEAQVAKARQSLAAAKASREAQYGEGMPEAEEKAANEASQAAKLAYETCQKRLEAKYLEREKQLGALNSTARDLLEASAELTQLSSALTLALEHSGVQTLTTYHAWVMDAAALTALETQIMALYQANDQAQSLEVDKYKLAQKAEKATVPLPLRVDLEEELKFAQGQLSMAEQSLGRLNEKLDEHKQKLAMVATFEQKIADQEQVLGYYKKLDDLVGGFDGKRFRNFAQAMAFEIMVSHANHQLKQLLGRYALKCRKGAPLELDVMDLECGGEIRPIKNLSGGESFLVSLSLALGLSKMNSKNVRIDSLFLDEGFGTLDANTLDTAMTALENLQQTGKTIVIISHVEALKDRIDSQIEVVKCPGGYSVLKGKHD